LENIVITWRELMILVALVLAVYIAEMLLVMRTSGGLRKPRWLDMIKEKRVETELRQELEALTARVEQLESLMKPVEGELEAGSPYNRAILLAKQGAEPERLVKECGISRGEADLIVSMQRQ
jgi:hypothetical protein